MSTITVSHRDAQTSEQDLLFRTQLGDMRAFGVLISRYADPIYKRAFEATQDSERANRLVNSVLKTAFSSMDQYNGNLSFLRWLQSLLKKKVHE